MDELPEGRETFPCAEGHFLYLVICQHGVKGEGLVYVEGACCHGNREPSWAGFGITDGTSEDVYVLRC